MEPTAPASPAAPAQPVAPITTTISATRDAANAGDFSKFQEAHDAVARGAAPARVEAVVDPKADEQVPRGTSTTPPPAPPTVSKRQQATNDAIRTATERAVADATRDANAEIARLNGLIPKGDAAPRRDAAPVAPAAVTTTVPEFRRIAALPDAPKVDDVDADGKPVYESLGEHAAAMTLFVNQTLRSEASTRTEGEQLAKVEVDRVSAFDTRVNEVAKTDPEIVSKILPLAQELGKAAGPKRIVGNVALGSEVGPQLLRYFGERPDELTRLTTLPVHLRGLPMKAAVAQHVQFIVKEIGKLEAQFDASAAASSAAPEPAPAAPSTVTAAPPPPPSLKRSGTSGDPKAAALARGDFATFQRIDLQEKIAARTHA